jgi:hypothetical protein
MQRELKRCFFTAAASTDLFLTPGWANERTSQTRSARRPLDEQQTQCAADGVNVVHREHVGAGEVPRQ